MTDGDSLDRKGPTSEQMTKRQRRIETAFRELLRRIIKAAAQTDCRDSFYLSVNDNRNTDVSVVVDGSYGIVGGVDAAVRAVVGVDVAAEA